MSFGTSGAAQLNGVAEINGGLAPNAVHGRNGIAGPRKATKPIAMIHLKGADKVAVEKVPEALVVEINGIEGHGNGHVADEALISEAIGLATLNPLRLALYQVTGDEELANMAVSKQAIRGGAMQDYVLSETDGEIVKAKAKQFLLGRSSNTLPPSPSKAEATKLMQVFAGHSLNEAERNLGYEELAFDEFPREIHWNESKKPSPDKLNSYRVAVVGGGISGVSTAVHLKRLGIPYIGIERQSDIGGTWLLNTYPEARVDTLGFLFQYKFVKGYKWKENFPSGDALRTYLKHVAAKYDVEKDFIFGRELVAAHWSDVISKWTLKLKYKDGIEEMEVNSIISAGGLFATPCLPEIAGITEYRGKMVSHALSIKVVLDAGAGKFCGRRAHRSSLTLQRCPRQQLRLHFIPSQTLRTSC